MYIGRSLKEYGEWSELEMDTFLHFVSAGDTVVDGGANIGAFTIPLAKKVGEHGQVYAYEAQRIVSQMLNANVALNELSNVHAFHRALGGVPGQTQVPVVRGVEVSLYLEFSQMYVGGLYGGRQFRGNLFIGTHGRS